MDRCLAICSGPAARQRRGAHRYGRCGGDCASDCADRRSGAARNCTSVGATLSIVLPNDANAKQIKIRTILPDPTDPDGDVLLYRIGVLDPATGALEELCEPDAAGERWAFPLQGQWDGEGRRISDQGFTLTCASDAQGKCVRLGYKPWKTTPDGTTLADYHQACVRLIRADYCGHQGTTNDGMLIDIYDHLGIQRPAEDAGRSGLHSRRRGTQTGRSVWPIRVFPRTSR